MEDAFRAANGAFADLPNELKTLGGLTAIDEVVLVAEDHDVLLIGPGEDSVDQEGMLFIVANGPAPLIRMEDWIVVMRSIQQGQIADQLFNRS